METQQTPQAASGKYVQEPEEGEGLTQEELTESSQWQEGLIRTRASVGYRGNAIYEAEYKEKATALWKGSLTGRQIIKVTDVPAPFLIIFQ